MSFNLSLVFIGADDVELDVELELVDEELGFVELVLVDEEELSLLVVDELVVLELVEMVVFDELDELVVDELFVPLQALRSERRIKVDNNVLNFFIFVSFLSVLRSPVLIFSGKAVWTLKFSQGLFSPPSIRSAGSSNSRQIIG